MRFYSVRWAIALMILSLLGFIISYFLFVAANRKATSGGVWIIPSENKPALAS